MSLENPPTARPLPLPASAGVVVPPIDETAHVGGIKNAPFDEVAESICVIAEAGDESTWLDGDGLPEDKNGPKDEADDIKPLQPHTVQNQPTSKAAVPTLAAGVPRRKERTSTSANAHHTYITTYNHHDTTNYNNNNHLPSPASTMAPQLSPLHQHCIPHTH